MNLCVTIIIIYHNTRKEPTSNCIGAGRQACPHVSGWILRCDGFFVNALAIDEPLEYLENFFTINSTKYGKNRSTVYVRMVLILHETGSISPCRWFWWSEIYNLGSPFTQKHTSIVLPKSQKLLINTKVLTILYDIHTYHQLSKYYYKKNPGAYHSLKHLKKYHKSLLFFRVTQTNTYLISV